MRKISIKAAAARAVHGAPDLLTHQFNDYGNSRRLIDMFGDDLRYCHDFKKWLVWDKMRWAIGDVGQARRLATQAMVEFFRQASELRSKEAEAFARQALDHRRIINALSLAEAELFVRPKDLDTHPYLLNFLNGTVDLRTGQLRLHDRGDFITKLVNFQYSPDATCPLWQAFLDRIMGAGPDASEGDLERATRMVKYLQQALGYSVTGSTREKAIFVPYGRGDNGKSTMLNAIRQLVEEYSTLLGVDTLMVRQESNNTQADLADLRGARFVQTSETEEGQRLAQGKLKRITQGMGTIKATRKYENPIEFEETHKLWLDTNRKPHIRDSEDRATFNRLHPIPFLVTIPAEELDRELPRKLLGEAEGILAWLVEGARLWHESGLLIPPEIGAAREQWHAEVDQIGQFLDERCRHGDGLRVKTSQLYSSYKQWTDEAGEKHVANSAEFRDKISKRGFEIRHLNAGDFYVGLGLRAGADSDGPDDE